MKKAWVLKVGIHLIEDIVDSLSWQTGRLRENTLGHGEKSNIESDEQKGEDGDDSDGDYRKTPPLFEVAKVGGSGMKSNNVVESPAKKYKEKDE